MRSKTARATTISPKFMNCFVALLTSAVLVVSGSCATAQTITGAIRGSVTDPRGAVVARVMTSATDVATGVIVGFWGLRGWKECKICKICKDFVGCPTITSDWT